MELARKPIILWGALAVAAVALLKPRSSAPRWWLQLSSATADWRRTTPSWGAPIVEYAVHATGVPAVLLAALIRTESAWNPNALSRVGAIGLAQLMPATARGLGVDPHDPVQNVLGGARYLRAQLDRFDDVALALAAYNAGPHRVVQYQGVPPFKETQAYVRKILSRLR